MVIRNQSLEESDYSDISSASPACYDHYNHIEYTTTLQTLPFLEVQRPAHPVVIHSLHPRIHAHRPAVRLRRNRRLLRLHPKSKQGRRARRGRTLELRRCEARWSEDIQRKPRRACCPSPEWFVLLLLPNQIPAQCHTQTGRFSAADKLTVFKTPSEATSPYSYVVCAHKALKLDNVIPDALEPAIGPATTIVIIQNGVGNEDPFRDRYPSNTIIGCVTWVGATQSSPGVIQHMKSENTELGLFLNASASPETEQAKLDTFTQLLRSGSTPFTVESDIQTKRWEKVVWNWFVSFASIPSSLSHLTHPI